MVLFLKTMKNERRTQNLAVLFQKKLLISLLFTFFLNSTKPYSPKFHEQLWCVFFLSYFLFFPSFIGLFLLMLLFFVFLSLILFFSFSSFHFFFFLLLSHFFHSLKILSFLFLVLKRFWKFQTLYNSFFLLLCLSFFVRFFKKTEIVVLFYSFKKTKGSASSIPAKYFL